MEGATLQLLAEPHLKVPAYRARVKLSTNFFPRLGLVRLSFRVRRSCHPDYLYSQDGLDYPIGLLEWG